MGSPNEYPPGHEYTGELITQLADTFEMNGLPYANITLSCDPIVTDEFDPAVVIQVTHAALFWPAGHPVAASRRKFEMVKVGATDRSTAEDVQMVRQLLLNATSARRLWPARTRTLYGYATVLTMRIRATA